MKDRQLCNDLLRTLIRIKDIAMDHPTFDIELFGEKDMQKIAEIDRELYDWTMIATMADDAIIEYFRKLKEGEKTEIEKNIA